MGKKKGIPWVGRTWHHGAAGCTARSVQELTAGAGARPCQVLCPTGERALEAGLRGTCLPLQSLLRAGSLSAGRSLGFGWEVSLNLVFFPKRLGGMLREENSKEVFKGGFIRKVSLMFSDKYLCETWRAEERLKLLQCLYI